MRKHESCYIYKSKCHPVGDPDRAGLSIAGSVTPQWFPCSLTLLLCPTSKKIQLHRTFTRNISFRKISSQWYILPSECLHCVTGAPSCTSPFQSLCSKMGPSSQGGTPLPIHCFSAKPVCIPQLTSTYYIFMHNIIYLHILAESYATFLPWKIILYIIVKEACLISKVLQRNENISKTLHATNDNWTLKHK